MDGLVAEAPEVLQFWFGEQQKGFSADAFRKRWFAGGEAFDVEIREQLSGTIAAAASGELDDWLMQPLSRLAYILVCDQLPRNLFRGSPQAFDLDPQALAAARSGIIVGADADLTFDERSFFYMPLEHSEDLLDQHACVGLFSLLRDRTPEGYRHLTGASLKYAQQHRDIVLRFGRFPHRNTVLQRSSTPEELKFLEEGPTFGQTA
ncbi:MAG: DUF924 domain-containing protein [Gammaproteobacteria bacterium]|nr:DUF924 domain-containing protein [Gammaproteobacteria bacterium]